MWHSCPDEFVYAPHILIIVVGVKTSGSPHVLKLWLGVSKGMLLVKYFCLTKPLFVRVKFIGDHKGEVNLITLCFVLLPNLNQWYLSICTYRLDIKKLIYDQMLKYYIWLLDVSIHIHVTAVNVCSS